MIYHNLANTDLKISAITFGAWAAGGWMWGGTDVNESIKAIQTSYENGVTSFDTAPVYGMGFSEEIVAKALNSYPRNSYQILTKFGLNWIDKRGEFYFHSQNNEGKPIEIYKFASKERVIEECEASLKRLNTDYIDLYQIHWPDPTTPISETFEAVEILIKQGKIKYAGVCNYNVAQTEMALQSSKIVSNQVPYSMLKREIETDLVPFCIKNNISILAYSPLQRGFLSGKFNKNTNLQDGDHRKSSPYLKEENLLKIQNFIKEIKPLSQVKNCTISQLVLAWTLRQKGITSLLVGARNEDQALENLHSINIKLTDEEEIYINKNLNLLPSI